MISHIFCCVFWAFLNRSILSKHVFDGSVFGFNRLCIICRVHIDDHKPLYMKLYKLCINHWLYIYIYWLWNLDMEFQTIGFFSPHTLIFFLDLCKKVHQAAHPSMLWTCSSVKSDDISHKCCINSIESSRSQILHQLNWFSCIFSSDLCQIWQVWINLKKFGTHTLTSNL